MTGRLWRLVKSYGTQVLVAELKPDGIAIMGNLSRHK